MIFITGDTHGDFTRFGTGHFPEQKLMTKEDYVIVCGDFGIWDGSKQENYFLDWLEDKPFTTLFVDGNHSNFDRLMQMPVKSFSGGKVHPVRESVLHLMRGQVFDVGGKRIFTMGGASSHDIGDGILEPDDKDLRKKRKALDRRRALYRINHVSWWKEELPSEKEYAEAYKNLDACGWEVDFIISHCAPSSIAGLIGGGMYRPDRLTEFFEELKGRCKFGAWFFGHYHDNRVLLKKYVLLYEQILQVFPPLPPL